MPPETQTHVLRRFTIPFDGGAVWAEETPKGDGVKFCLASDDEGPLEVLLPAEAWKALGELATASFSEYSFDDGKGPRINLAVDTPADDDDRPF